MGLVDITNTAYAIRGILKETIGTDYKAQLAKRAVLNKDDKLIYYIKLLEMHENMKILED